MHARTRARRVSLSLSLSLSFASLSRSYLLVATLTGRFSGRVLRVPGYAHIITPVHTPKFSSTLSQGR